MTSNNQRQIDMRSHFDWVAGHDAKARAVQSGFHRQQAAIHRHHIPEGARVLEIGCGGGDLLAALRPCQGTGIDFSPAMVAKARSRHGSDQCLEFSEGDANGEYPQGDWDFIVWNYLAGYLTDIQAALERASAAARPHTRLHLTTLNTPWRMPVDVAQSLGLVMPQPPSNWLSRHDLANLLNLSGWELIFWRTEQLFPFELPGVSVLCNRWLARLPVVRNFGITLHMVARLKPLVLDEKTTSLSVVVPMRNESGNVRPALDRIPVLGGGTEVIFVEGNSKDDTMEVLQRELAAYTGPLRTKLLRQPGKGKWDAVKAGFDAATGDILAIQDGDLTAPPEDLPKFFHVVCRGTAEFANGSRLVYPMESRAMRFLNLLGNKFFAMCLSALVGQQIKDSLCGTKVLKRSDYLELKKRGRVFGPFDPFGDFFLLFGAALMPLRIVDVPVRYKDRTYGETNIHRFRHGLILLKMTLFGLSRLLFFPLQTTDVPRYGDADAAGPSRGPSAK
jgi:SAM-dependent methyltransferase